MVDDKDKDGIPNIDDEAFDDIDFESVDDLDDAVYDDVTDPDADIDFDGDAENEEFAEEEWSEEDVKAAAKDKKKAKKEKSLYADSYKKPLMSFNTMVILGAFLLGGSVLIYTVMSKSSQLASSKQSLFHSMLNIGEVMDGGIFGDSEKKDALSSGTEETPATPDGTQPAAEQGFLDNPAGVLKDETKPEVVPADGTPPQPTPISPSETSAGANEPLTPMPADGAAPETVPVVPIDAASNPAPRTPDEYVDVTAPTPSADAPKQSAADLLKEAMANRAEKLDGKKDTAAKPDVKSEPVVADETPDVTAPSPKIEPAPVAAVDISAPAPKAKPIEIPAPAPVAEAPPEDKAKLKEAADAATEANKKAADLQKKIDSLTAKVDSLQSELGTVKSSNQGEVRDLQSTIKSLKQDLAAKATAPVHETKVANVDQTQSEPKATPAPKKKVVKKTPKPAAPKVAQWPHDNVYATPPVAAAPARWELRAAQPGRAWVSKPGSRDMQGVIVGQTLPGIGQITSINYQNGRWTVQGTTGQILQ